MLPVQDVEVVGAQLPGRVREGRPRRVQGAGAQAAGPALPVRAPAGEALGAVQVPEARGVRHVHQLALLGPPRLAHRVPVAAVDGRLLADRAVGQQVAHVQHRLVPRHARVVPGDPRQVLPVGRQDRGGDEVRAPHERAHRGVIAGGRAVQGDGHERVDRFAPAPVVLPHRVDQAPPGVDLQVAVAHVPVDRQGHQAAQPVVDVVAVQAPVPGVGDHHDPRVHRVGPPAVLVHARAHVHQLVRRRQRQDLADLPVAVAAQQHIAARLGGALLHPVGVGAVDAHLGQAHRAGRDRAGGDGGGPGAVGGGGAHGCSSCSGRPGAGRRRAARTTLRAPPPGVRRPTVPRRRTGRERLCWSDCP